MGVGESLSDEGPELWAVIEFGQVAEFVHDDVVHQFWRELDDFVIEIQVTFL